MSTPVRARVHEWFADRLPWVQHPQIRPLARRRRPRFAFKHQMLLWKRFVLLQLGLALTLVGLALLAVGLLVGYAVVRAILDV